MSLTRIHYVFILAIMLFCAAVIVALPTASSADTPLNRAVVTPVKPVANGVINPNIKIRLPLNPLVRGFLVAYPGARAEITAVAVRAQPQLAKSIYLPGVKLVLDNVSTHQQSTAVLTDLSGRFTLRAPAGGSYRICWSSPIYGAGCTTANWTIGARPLYVSSVPLVLPFKKGMATFYGHVTDVEGSSVRTYQPYFNVNAFAQVMVGASGGARFRSKVFVNNLGDYLVPYVPVNQRMTVIAAVEKGRAEQDILPGATLVAGSYNQLNLKIGNHAPKLSPLAAGDAAGNRVQSANVGDEVVVTAPARDDDPGDTISYRWYASAGDGTLSQQTGPVVKWKMPSTPGRHTISVIAYDEHGGYDLGSLSLLADGNGVPFSGHIVTTYGAPIANATIAVIGNAPVTTNASGYFVTRVITASRYVFNARAKGYALNSQIYDHGVTGGRWILHSAETVVIDPTKSTTITNRRNERDCVGPEILTARTGPAGSSIHIPQWQDGKGHVIDAPKAADKLTLVSARDNERFKLSPCRAGVTVSLPPNAIVDGGGRAVTAPITAFISTVDLASPQQMPGDDGVKTAGGGGAALESFGAGSFDLPAGMKLKPGVKARVTIPVDRLPLSGGVTPPVSIPLLSYDENQGEWLEGGTLTLQTIAGAPVYVGEVSHFSPFNADNVKNNSSACIRLFSQTLPSKYNLEVSAPYQGTGAPKIVSHQIDQTDGNENVLYNLPNNVNVTLTATTIGSPSTLLGTFIVNSGNAANPNNSPLAPTYVTDAAHPGDVTKNGYIACNNFIVIKSGSAPGSPVGGEFLHGLGVLDAENLGFTDLTGAAPTGNALIDAVVKASNDYYSQVDPNSLRLDFATFKSINGFAALAAGGLGNGEYVAQYANSGDLGFGRDMHCRVTDASHGYMACYVTNYGTGYNNIPFGNGTDDQDDANAAGQRASVGASLEVATVAMEYSPIEGDVTGVPVVKFFVYFNKLGYPRVIDANLDGRGQRPVPQLCMTCHGGFAPSQAPVQGAPVPIFSNAADTHLGARFLPFDYRLYTFPNDNPALTSSAQDPQFKHLNQDIVDKVPAGVATSDPIREVIQALYNGGNTELIDSPVPGWQTGGSNNLPGQAQFYNHAFAWACRTCHIAQPFTQIQFNTSAGLQTLSATNLPTNNFLMMGTVQNRVCGDYLMPHALRTHDIFWGNYTQYLSPSVTTLNMPQEVQNFGDGVVAANPSAGTSWKPNLCTSFTSSNATSPSTFYEQSVQPIFNGKCVGCHAGNFAPDGLDLTEGNSLGKLHALNLVVPGNDDPNAAGNEMLKRVTTNQMPQGCNPTPTPPGSYYTCLTPTDIAILKAWVKSGAK